MHINMHFSHHECDFCCMQKTTSFWGTASGGPPDLIRGLRPWTPLGDYRPCPRCANAKYATGPERAPLTISVSLMTGLYLTQVNTPRLHPSQIGWYSICRPFKGGGLSKPRPRVQRATGLHILHK